ncbi:MAG: helix-turn-helix transcriptional regulator [Clostridia bacterium]|nr:helix-turn-helix transcriptional regulator [Clostridia bacterium]
MFDIGKNIRFYRTLNGLSMEDLGEKIGVQKQTIQKYETGKIVNIPSQKIEKIAAVLSVEPTALTSEDAYSVFCELKKSIEAKNQQAYRLGDRRPRHGKHSRRAYVISSGRVALRGRSASSVSHPSALKKKA